MKFDFEFSAEKASVSGNYGRKIDIEIEGAESDDVIEYVVDAVGLESVIDRIGIDNILEEIGFSEIGKWLNEQGYLVVEEE